MRLWYNSLEGPLSHQKTQLLSVYLHFFAIFIADSISYNDFCDIMRKEKPLNKESLIKAFKCFDTNGDGYITYDELFGLLTKVLCASLARGMNVWIIVYIFNKWHMSCSTAVLREPLLNELERTSAFCAFFISTHVHFFLTF